jgi:hypothetical protein
MTAHGGPRPQIRAHLPRFLDELLLVPAACADRTTPRLVRLPYHPKSIGVRLRCGTVRRGRGSSRRPWHPRQNVEVHPVVVGHRCDAVADLRAVLEELHRRETETTDDGADETPRCDGECSSANARTPTTTHRELVRRSSVLIRPKICVNFAEDEYPNPGLARCVTRRAAARRDVPHEGYHATPSMSVLGSRVLHRLPVPDAASSRASNAESPPLGAHPAESCPRGMSRGHDTGGSGVEGCLPSSNSLRRRARSMVAQNLRDCRMVSRGRLLRP